MELNLKLVEEVAALLQIDASTLQEGLTTTETIVELPKKIYTQSEVDILSDNIQKEKYEFGKTAGVEMNLKELKKAYSDETGIELDGIKDYKELITKIADFKTEKLKLEIQSIKDETGQETNAQIEALQLKLEKKDSESEALRKTIKENELKAENSLLQLKNNFNKERGNNSLNRQFAGLQFNVPKQIQSLGEEEVVKYLKTQQNNAVDLFKTKFKIDYDEEGNELVIDKSTNEIIKDNLQNNQKLENLINPFAKSQYLNIISEEKQAGRTPGNNGRKISYVGMTDDQFMAEMANKGIKNNTEEFDAKYSEFKKAN